MASRKNASASKLSEVSEDLIQIHQDINYHTAIATGASVATAVGVMAVLGRFTFVYGPKTNMLGYLWLFLFAAPLVLTYSERFDAISGPGGVYGLVRNRFGLPLSFFVGWLELGGYAAIIAILARTIVIYSLTLYNAFGGDVQLNLKWLTMGVVILFFIFKATGWRGGDRLNTLFVYAGLLLLLAAALYSIFSYRETLTGLSTSLRTVRPLRLSAMLLSSFWGILLVYGLRNRFVRRREKRNVVASVHWGIMLVVIVLGALLAIGTLPSSSDAALTGVLSVNTFNGVVFAGSATITALIAFFTLVMAFIGLSRSFQGSIEVVSMMTADNFFPRSFNYRLRRAIFPPLLIVAVLAVVLIFFMDTMVVVGMAAAFLLGITILVHLPDIILSSPKLPDDRSIHLPYHPLFPALTVVAATVAIFNLEGEVLQWSLAWAGIGAVMLSSFSYRRALHARGKRQTYDESTGWIADERKNEALDGKDAEAIAAVQQPVVLTFIRDMEHLPRIVALGSKIAARFGATLNLVQIVEVGESPSLHEQKKRGEEMWTRLASAIVELQPATGGVVIKPMVRMSSNLIEGVINAAQESRAYVLLLPPDFIDEDAVRNIEQYNKILQLARGNILFMNRFPAADDPRHITVLIGDGGQAPTSLMTADALIAEDGVIEVIHFVSQDNGSEVEKAARERIQALIDSLDVDKSRVTINLLRTSTLEEAVHELVSDTDLLLLGASHNFMTRRAFFGGVSARIFQSLSVPTLLVRADEKIRFAWLSRLWEIITDPLPKLTQSEREEVVQEVTSGASPSVDFFVLIILSSGIAMYGLLQNSGAVIIGAMLVAPLMSPIVSMAMSLVRGDIKNLGIGAQSTAQGVLMAIFVGALLTFFSPIRQPTNEILSRVNPNLLDLGVAFLSGAAGGYAMSRKSIAAALPGVAIAAALVPPLAVVGYGFAVADLSIAFGALLLFTTNLIAIVLAAALVFLALDFLSPEKQTWGEIVRGLKVTVVLLGVIVIILGVVTYRSVREQQQLAAIHKVMTKSLYSQSFEPLDVQIKGHLDAYQITATLLSYDKPLSSEDLNQLGKELEAAVGAPVTFDLTIISAERARFDIQSEVTVTQIDEAVRKTMSDLPLEVVSIQTQPIRDGYDVDLVVVEFQRNALSQRQVDDLEAELSEQFDASFNILVYKLPAEKLEAGGTPTPTPEAASPAPGPVPASTPAP